MHIPVYLQPNCSGQPPDTTLAAQVVGLEDALLFSSDQESHSCSQVTEAPQGLAWGVFAAVSSQCSRTGSANSTATLGID